ncbi:glycosyltransferase family 2 protein [Chryseobacterium formosus]|uniref:Glycosyltransferase family 2 protein n=1 Tax=Chryseobacterium formosus TaxID=1537363 RepID=A0ABT3XXL1_9FLAO|nr:glycosyltransferase family A protein [Chryseobacterium formosus]MCX8526412.1 glycosyltransferase family 2 protein [Chryseobacterium formosus]
MKNPPEHFTDSFFSRFSILPNVKFSIVIPVKDEEDYISKTLTAFTLQVDILGNPLDFDQFEILILANNCSDKSVALIKQFQNDYPNLNIYLQEVILSAKQANIGYVRRKLMECAYTRLNKNGGGLIMTTDGDTTVAPDWISQTYREICNGAEVVGGRILLYADEMESLDQFTRLLHLKDERYHLLVAELEGKIINQAFDPFPRHHQHFNGSFAITSESYARSGGVPHVEHLEDCAFFERLQALDIKIRHSYDVKVHTSARCVGRTQIGLSYQLNVWKNLGKNADHYFVESCASITKRLTQKRSLNDLWKIKNEITEFDFIEIINKKIPEIAVDEELYNNFQDSIYFGEWYEKLLTLQHSIYKDKSPESSPIDTAIKELQMKIQEYSGHNFSQTSIL